MALKMTNREVDGVSVVALDGRIVLGEESNALREKVKGLIAAGKRKIVLNMDNITFIDSAGLGTLVAAHHRRPWPAFPKAPEHKRPSRILVAEDGGFAPVAFADGRSAARLTWRFPAS